MEWVADWVAEQHVIGGGVGSCVCSVISVYTVCKKVPIHCVTTCDHRNVDPIGTQTSDLWKLMPKQG